MRNLKPARILTAVCLLLAAVLMTGCTKKKAEIHSLSDLKNEAYTIGMPADISMQDRVMELCPQAELQYMDGVAFIEPLRSGRIDAFIGGEMELLPIAKEYSADGFTVLDEPLATYEIALGLSPATPVENYVEKVNACILRYKEDGTMDEMKARWAGINPVKAEITAPEDPAYTIKAATCGVIRPNTYYENGVLTGMDVELAERIAADLGCGIEWEVADFGAMLAGLATGKYDMVSSNLFKTAERAEAIIYSESYFESRISLITVHTKTETGFNSLKDLNGAKIFASVTGSIYPQLIREQFPQAEVSEYNSMMDSVFAVQSKKADAAVYDEPMITHVAAENPDLKVLSEKLMEEDYYFCTAKSEAGTALAKDFNLWLAEAEKTGELAELTAFWLGNESPEGRCDFASLPGGNGKLIIGADITSRPSNYMYNDNTVGLPLEIIYRYCADRGLKAELQIMDFGAFPVAVSSGKVDIFVSFLSYTEERAESMTFTDPIYHGGVAVLVRNAETSGVGSFFNDLADGFDKTFVRESRWKLILSGLGVTLLITLGSFVLANLLGALFCGFNLSGKKALHVAADIYSRIMQGTPMVVVLMILYYVIFGKTQLRGEIVSILGFGLVSGAGLAQTFEESVRGIDRGQTEAALALGFSPAETFRGIIFPQAARAALPGYFSELIALLKGTSIVGYIAVVDLTKASDIIRASTYEAFFPLISIAVIYFIIINILLSVMKAIRKGLAPKRVKGKEAEK